MIEIELLPILIVELVLSIVSIIFLVVEIKSMSSVLFNKKTVLLFGFLFSLTFAYLTRSTGIYLSKNYIRFFGPTVSAVFGGMFIIAWATSIIRIDPKYQYLTITSFIGGIVLFVIGRGNGIFIFEISGLLLAMLTIIGVVLKMFFFAFQKSPYIKARQRVFGMMIGFIGFSIFEVAAVVAMSNGKYIISAILFLMELPFRFVLTMSILLPNRVFEILSKWIN